MLFGNHVKSQAWWRVLVISAPERQRQAELRGSLVGQPRLPVHIYPTAHTSQAGSVEEHATQTAFPAMGEMSTSHR